MPRPISSSGAKVMPKNGNPFTNFFAKRKLKKEYKEEAKEREVNNNRAQLESRIINDLNEIQLFQTKYKDDEKKCAALENCIGYVTQEVNNPNNFPIDICALDKRIAEISNKFKIDVQQGNDLAVEAERAALMTSVDRLRNIILTIDDKERAEAFLADSLEYLYNWDSVIEISRRIEDDMKDKETLNRLINDYQTQTDKAKNRIKARIDKDSAEYDPETADITVELFKNDLTMAEIRKDGDKKRIWSAERTAGEAILS